jgi:hypothetical protein
MPGGRLAGRRGRPRLAFALWPGTRLRGQKAAVQFGHLGPAQALSTGMGGYWRALWGRRLLMGRKHPAGALRATPAVQLAARSRP